MKKRITLLTFLILLLAFAANTLAQTPQYYNYNTTAGANSFPFNIAAGKEVQWLVLPHDFNQTTQAPSGNITAIYFYMAGAGSHTFTDILIKLGLATITSLPSGVIYTGPMDTVYFKASQTLTSTASTWMMITLDHPFLYDTSKSLVIDVSQCGYTGSGTMTVNQTALTPVRRCYINGTASCVFTYSGQDGSIANCGVDITPVSPVVCTYSWTAQTSGTTNLLQGQWAVSDQVAWIAGAAGTVRKTINGGTTWTDANPNPGIINGDIYNICAFDANTAWCTTSPTSSNSYIYRTSNGGTNWTQVLSVGGSGPFIDAIVFTNATTGFAYGDPPATSNRWSLWKSTNGGVNWDSAGLNLPTTGAEAGWNNAMCIIGNNIWFGTNNTKVYHSTNFGAAGSWSAGVTTGTINTYCVWFTSATNGMCGNTVMLKSTDGGATWISAGTPGGSGGFTSVSGSGNYFWVNRGTNIYGTTDFGVTWTGASFTGTNALDAMMNIPAGSNQCLVGWSAGATGALVKLTGLPVGIANNNNQIPNSYNLLQNYPNPFNPTTKISFALPKAGNVELKVYDLLGREVATLINETRTAGNYTVDFNASSIASGVYFYTIKSGDFTATKKMVLIK